MTPRSVVLAVACLLTASACISDGAKPFTVAPEPRGFELPERPVILFFVDGLRADLLQELVANGELPRMRRLLFDRGTSVRSAVTCVPSVTYANAVSMLTGCWPSTHGAWSNASFDRDQLRTVDYEGHRERATADVSRESMFELRGGELTAGIALPFERGVKISRVQSAETGGIEFGWNWITGQKQAADESIAEQFQDIGDTARRIGQWPAFIAVYIPATDETGHEKGSDSPEYRDAVRNLDDVIGALLEAFEAGGMLDELTVVLTSDHGHHPSPWSLDLQRYLSAALQSPVVVGPKDEGEDEAEATFLERWEHYAPARIVAIPNGYREASLHLRAGEHWDVRPSFEQILAFAGEGAPVDAPGHRLPDRLASPAISLVAVRAGEHEVRVYTPRGTAAIRRTNAESAEPLFAYEVLDGRDPLLYDEVEGLPTWMQSAHPSREWLAATADTSRPDVVPQLLTAFDDPRSGDVILFAAPGWDFAPGEYLGGHGGLEREELIVPLVLAGPGISAGAELASARLVDLVPTLIELAGVPVANPAFDGVSLAQELGRAGQPPANVAEGRSP